MGWSDGAKAGGVAEDAVDDEFQEGGFVFHINVDLEPGEIERGNGAFEAGGAVEAIFFGGYQNLGAAGLGLTGDALRFEGLIDVVIVESPAEGHLEPERFERSPEVFGIAETAKGGDASGGQIRHRRVGAVIAPVTRDEASAKNGRARIVFAQALGDVFKARFVFNAGDDEEIGPAQSRKRLAQPAERNQSAAAEGVQAINDENIDVAMYAGMLKAIIEQQHIGCGELREQ